MKSCVCTGAVSVNWRLVLLLLLGVIVTGCGNPSPAPASATTNAPASRGTNVTTAKSDPSATTNAIIMHQAAFAPLPGARDPFFPTSSRLPVAPGDSQTTNQPPPRLPLSSYIKLTGIRPTKTRPFAMINQTFFEPGERGEISVQIPNSAGSTDVMRVRIRCLEIREDSVLISIEGEAGTKELRQPVGP